MVEKCIIISLEEQYASVCVAVDRPNPQLLTYQIHTGIYYNILKKVGGCGLDRLRKSNIAI